MVEEQVTDIGRAHTGKKILGVQGGSANSGFDVDRAGPVSGLAPQAGRSLVDRL
jgi:hypothetical protein